MSDLDYISNYFEKNLSQEEMKRFDEKIVSDPGFAEEVAFYCSAIQEIKSQSADEKKKRFREIYELQGLDKNNRPPVVYMNKWWKTSVAAAVLMLLAASWFWWSQPSAIQLADKYVQDNFSKLPVTMGKSDSLQDASALYNKGELKGSLLIFEQLAGKGSLEITAIKNAGIVSLQLKEYDKALAYFAQLEKMTLYANPGMFYHALTLIKRNQAGDAQKAKELLQQVIQQELEGKETAAKWLKKL